MNNHRPHIILKPERLCQCDDEPCHFPKEGCFNCERRKKGEI
jgi:hypothetical protein